MPNSTRLFAPGLQAHGLKPACQTSTLQSGGQKSPRPSLQSAHTHYGTKGPLHFAIRPNSTLLFAHRVEITDIFAPWHHRWSLGQICPETAQNQHFFERILKGSCGPTSSGSASWTGGAALHAAFIPQPPTPTWGGRKIEAEAWHHWVTTRSSWGAGIRMGEV